MGFTTLEHPQTPTFPYKGDPVEDLKKMRRKIHGILRDAFPTATLDDSGSKALAISGGSLYRKIDVVPSNWYDSNYYVKTKDQDYRGINILDRDNNTRILNYPFLHMYWINQKDFAVEGGEKRMIRLLKSLKVDADVKINVSGYDIASLVYRMENRDLTISKAGRLKLLYNTNEYLKKVIHDYSFRDSLYVPNGTRKIFCTDGAKVDEVAKLQKELQDLIVSIAQEIKPIYENFEKANVNYSWK